MKRSIKLYLKPRCLSDPKPNLFARKPGLSLGSGGILSPGGYLVPPEKVPKEKHSGTLINLHIRP